MYSDNVGRPSRRGPVRGAINWAWKRVGMHWLWNDLSRRVAIGKNEVIDQEMREWRDEDPHQESRRPLPHAELTEEERNEALKDLKP